MNTNLDQLAIETHAAMREAPPHVQLANALLTAQTRDERNALLDAADITTREAALRYATEPDGTRERDRRAAWMREDPLRIAALKHYYASHLADFISDWGVTVDPRRVAKGQHALVPFNLWPKQVELVEWMLERWRSGEHGTVVKSRDVGASWCAVALLAALCIFNRNFAAGVASSTEAKMDLSDNPDTLFAKLRAFLQHLPLEFAAGYSREKTDKYLRISFPETDSSVTGEAGDQAGRGGRKSLYVVDEAAFFEHPKLIEASLAATTDSTIWVSTPNGIGNSFYEKAHNPAVPRFDITWRDDPRKDDAWYAHKVATLDPVVVAAEINCDFAASVQGVVIPSAWVQAAIGLHERLGIDATGTRYAALDVGDTNDKSALSMRHGIVLEHVESWSGANSDIHATTARAFRLCDEHELDEMLYDADGIGANVRGAARVLNEPRAGRVVKVVEYRGSSSPVHPERKAPRTNVKWKDYVANRKAQAFMHLRSLFEQSWQASRGEPYDPDHIISINPKIPELARLTAELSQPTMDTNAAGKVLIDKYGDGTSPNLCDSVVMVFAPRVRPMRISDAMLEMI
jgi:hypothetical protein